MPYLYFQNGGTNLNNNNNNNNNSISNNKAILDAPIPATVPITATPLSAVPVTSASAPAPIATTATLPEPLLPATQTMEAKQEIVENYLNSLPPVTINNITNGRYG